MLISGSELDICVVGISVFISISLTLRMLSKAAFIHSNRISAWCQPEGGRSAHHDESVEQRRVREPERPDPRHGPGEDPRGHLRGHEDPAEVLARFMRAVRPTSATVFARAFGRAVSAGSVRFPFL